MFLFSCTEKSQVKKSLLWEFIIFENYTFHTNSESPIISTKVELGYENIEENKVVSYSVVYDKKLKKAKIKEVHKKLHNHVFYDGMSEQLYNIIEETSHTIFENNENGKKITYFIEGKKFDMID